MTRRAASRHRSAGETTAKHCKIVSFCTTYVAGLHAMAQPTESSANPQARRELATLIRAGSLQIGHRAADSIFEGRRLA